MHSKVSVRNLAGTLQRPHVTVQRMVRRLRENVNLTVSTLSLKGVVELDEVCVTAGLKGNRSHRR